MVAAAALKGAISDEPLMQIHLDPVGGVAGDMFIAALLSAFPELQEGVLRAIRRAVPEVDCRLSRHNDGVLDGQRFSVALCAGGHAHADHDHHHHDHDHDHGHVHAHDHGHRPWKDIRLHLQTCGLAPEVARHAVAIFAGLAEAEGRVHGVSPEEVAFHEVGAWDSIADIVGAAYLIATLGAGRWTTAALPLGSGRVKTAHGLLPVPAPATAILMQGFATLDDGVAGERVTPTGAAILRYLCGDPAPWAGPRVLAGSGVGFGARTLPGISNCLRVLVFEEAVATPASDPGVRELAVVEFEVDDQSAEDLAMGLDRLRAHPAVIDVVQAPAFGKKGRMTAAVRLLAAPEGLDPVIAAVFSETATIGLRHHRVTGAVLARAAHEVEVEGHSLRVKVVERPGGRTAKTESDDVLAHEGQGRRAELRRLAEAKALRGEA
jgi:uncharacterized protein (TIGR00299 family) protein